MPQKIRQGLLCYATKNAMKSKIVKQQKTKAIIECKHHHARPID